MELGRYLSRTGLIYQSKLTRVGIRVELLPDVRSLVDSGDRCIDATTSAWPTGMPRGDIVLTFCLRLSVSAISCYPRYLASAKHFQQESLMLPGVLQTWRLLYHGLRPYLDREVSVELAC